MIVTVTLCSDLYILRIGNMSIKAYSPHKGFTLIELLITLVVASILLGVMAPSFVDLIKNSRLTADINELSASLNLSRSEAIKRGAEVTTCSSNNGTNCNGNWHDGWIVFQDMDSNGTVDSADTLILEHKALSTNTTLNYNKGNKIIHQPSGFSSSGYAGTFKLCDDRGESYVKALVISFSGRIQARDANDGLTGCTGGV